MSSTSSFIVGFLVGVSFSVGSVLYLLSSKTDSTQKSVSKDINKHVNTKETNDNLSTNAIKEEAKLIEDSLDKLRGLKDINIVNKDEIKSYYNLMKSLTNIELEIKFTYFIKQSKEREKHIRNLTTFFNDITKIYNNTSKDIYKIISHTTSNTTTHKSDPLSSTTTSTSTTNNDNVWEYWWPSLINTLQKQAIDSESAYEVISKEIVTPLTKLYEEQNNIMRHYNNEGTLAISHLKDLQLQVEVRTRDRDKWREKLNQALDRTSSLTNNNTANTTSTSNATTNNNTYNTYNNTIHNTPVGLALSQLASNIKQQTTPSQANQEANNNKLLQKLEICENDINTANDKLQSYEIDYHQIMARILTDLYITSYRIIVDVKKILLKYVNTLHHIHGNAPVLAQTLRSEIRAVFLKANYEEITVFMGQESSLVLLLNDMYQYNQDSASTTVVADAAVVATTSTAATLGSGDAVAAGSATAASTISTTGSGGVKANAWQGDKHMLNMGLESTSILAACSPLLLPSLPRAIQQCIGSESCVWLNALLGRVYRDMRHSVYFNYWCVAKASSIFNKGTRPDYVVDFEVLDVDFGPLPPLILNMTWLAPTSSPYTSAATDDGAKGQQQQRRKSMDPDTVDATTNPATVVADPVTAPSSSADHYATPTKTTRTSDPPLPSPSPTQTPPPPHAKRPSTTSTASGPSTPRQAPPGPPPPPPLASSSARKPKVNTSREREREDAEYNVHWKADVLFRSGVNIKVSTK